MGQEDLEIEDAPGMAPAEIEGAFDCSETEKSSCKKSEVAGTSGRTAEDASTPDTVARHQEESGQPASRGSTNPFGHGFKAVPTVGGDVLLVRPVKYDTAGNVVHESEVLIVEDDDASVVANADTTCGHCGKDGANVDVEAQLGEKCT